MVTRAIDTPGSTGAVSDPGDEKGLTLAFQRGDDGAYHAIYDRYRQRVHAVCRRMLVNPEDAAEASQETFLRVYQGLGRFNGRYQLNAWITRIATNVCLDQLRAKGRRGQDLTAFEIADLDAPCEPDDLPEEVVMRRSEGRRVRKVLASLPPMHRAAIVLRDFEGMSYQEVADALEISDAQVKALLHRARQRFKRDWIGSLAALLPWRLVQRVRDSGNVTRDSGVLGSAAQMAPTCTNAMQQCGQYVLDKLAPVLTTAVVVTTAVAPGASSLSDPPKETALTVAHQEDEEAVQLSRSGARLKERRGDNAMAASRSETSSDVEEDATVPEPATTPEPAPTPTPTAAEGEPSDPNEPPADENGGTGGMAGPVPTTPPRGPFTPSIGFDWGRGIPGRAPSEHAAEVDCLSTSFSQRTSTVIEDDDSPVTYPALLIVKASGSTLSLEFSVWKNSTEIFYSGTGELVQENNSSSAFPDMQYKGSFGTFNQQVHSIDLPAKGVFVLDVGLDCARRQLITETFRLSR